MGNLTPLYDKIQEKEVMKGKTVLGREKREILRSLSHLPYAVLLEIEAKYRPQHARQGAYAALVPNVEVKW